MIQQTSFSGDTGALSVPASSNKRRTQRASRVHPAFPPLSRPLVVSDDIRELTENPVILSEDDLRDPVMKAMANEDFR